MRKPRSFEVPTVMKHGLGAIEGLGEEAATLGLKRPLIVTDPAMDREGILAKATRSMRAANIGFALFDEVAPNPPVALVQNGAAFYRQESCDGLVGLGGGSSLDTAKAIGVVISNGGSILEYEWADPQPIRTRIPPTICVPTTAGTGSEVTLWAVITDPERQIKFNVGGTSLIGPWVALIDPELTLSLSPAMTAGTGMDALAHAVECYTCDYAQPITDAVALQAMEYIGRYLRVAFIQGDNVEARYKMCMAAMLAGLSYGTESAGAAHAMSQTAGGVHDVPHGTLTAGLLGPVMEFNYVAAPERFARIALALGEDVSNMPISKAAEKSVEAVMSLTRDLGISSMQSMGFASEEIPALADLAFKDPQTIGNPRALTLDDYVGIYRRAFELGET
jgi:choline dehydrogenase